MAGSVFAVVLVAPGSVVSSMTPGFVYEAPPEFVFGSVGFGLL